jgi:hypothetical protein
MVGAEREWATTHVRAEMLGIDAADLDGVHDVHRTVALGPFDRIIAPREFRPQLIEAVERGLARQLEGWPGTR